MTAAPFDADQLADLASKALADGTEADAAPLLDRAAREAGSNALLWQWAGLLHRALDEHAPALTAFEEAARLEPNNPSIAHGFARVTLEAGSDARRLFDRALKLGPSADVILGRAAARYAMGEGEAAAAELATILQRNPLWTQGHIQWAQLMAMTGNPQQAMATIDTALASQSSDAGLWHAAIHILTSAERHAEAREKCDAAIAAMGDARAFALARAAALSDAGETEAAEQAFAGLGEPRTVDHAVHLARHLIRAGRWDELAQLTERWMSGEGAHFFWPYASICWRQSGDPRWQWLEGDERLVRILDLSDRISLDALAERLRTFHARSGRYLDQSVRGGTQTDGPLLSRLDPEIHGLRAAIVAAVEEYRAALPALDPTHPMLRYRRDRRIRFAGSWSVRLEGSGYHSNHVHPEGWISSAFYVAVPEGLKGDEGWLTLGEPQAELGLAMPPIRKVEPMPGRLVLFPSMMWHGTLPFEQGERMTVAFDVAPPR